MSVIELVAARLSLLDRAEVARACPQMFSADASREIEAVAAMQRRWTEFGEPFARARNGIHWPRDLPAKWHGRHAEFSAIMDKLEAERRGILKAFAGCRKITRDRAVTAGFPRIAMRASKSPAIGLSHWLGPIDHAPRTVRLPKNEYEVRPTFICQVDCADLEQHDLFGVYPSTGVLYFFASYGCWHREGQNCEDLVQYSPEPCTLRTPVPRMRESDSLKFIEDCAPAEDDNEDDEANDEDDDYDENPDIAIEPCGIRFDLELSRSYPPDVPDVLGTDASGDEDKKAIGGHVTRGPAAYWRADFDEDSEAGEADEDSEGAETCEDDSSFDGNETDDIGDDFCQERQALMSLGGVFNPTNAFQCKEPYYQLADIRLSDIADYSAGDDAICIFTAAPYDMAEDVRAKGRITADIRLRLTHMN